METTPVITTTSYVQVVNDGVEYSIQNVGQEAVEIVLADAAPSANAKGHILMPGKTFSSDVYGQGYVYVKHDGPESTTLAITTDSFSNLKYFHFGGTNEHLSCSAVNIGTTHTINLWFKYDSAPATWHSFLGNSSVSYNVCCYKGADNNILYAPSADAVVTVTQAEDDSWHMLTITRDGTAINFYIDGVQVGTEQTLAGNSDFIFIYVGRFGSIYTEAGAFMDELYINSAVLDSSDIATLYGGGTPETAGNPLSLSNGLFYINFEDDTLPTVTDLIGSVVLTGQNLENDEIESH